MVLCVFSAVLISASDSFDIKKFFFHMHHLASSVFCGVSQTPPPIRDLHCACSAAFLQVVLSAVTCTRVGGCDKAGNMFMLSCRFNICRCSEAACLRVSLFLGNSESENVLFALHTS